MFIEIKRIIVVLSVVAVTFGFSACTEGKPDFTHAANFNVDPPPGPPEYQQGWKDGCETGRAAYANHFYKMFLDFKQDEDLSQNPIYYQVWKDAYLYCWYQTETGYNHGWGNFR